MGGKNPPKQVEGADYQSAPKDSAMGAVWFVPSDFRHELESVVDDSADPI